MKERSYRRIEAVRKAGEILKHLGKIKEPATAKEIAGAVGLAQGTTLCHLATLEDLGFVQQVGEHWRIGTGLALIWARVRSNLEGEREKINEQLAIINGQETEEGDRGDAVGTRDDIGSGESRTQNGTGV